MGSLASRQEVHAQLARIGYQLQVAEAFAHERGLEGVALDLFDLMQELYRVRSSLFPAARGTAGQPPQRIRGQLAIRDQTSDAGLLDRVPAPPRRRRNRS